jgi:hypothetical protein
VVLAVPAALAGRVELAARAVPGASEVQEGSAVQVALAAQAVPAGQAASVVPAVREGLAVRGVPGGREALAVQAGQAVRADPAGAPVPRRDPLVVLLGGRTSAAREARPWAV